MKKFLLVSFVLALAVVSAEAQSKKKFQLPEINGIELVKCDLHMHTVYSDGMVWPTVRIDEAVRDGMDAIAFTDHIEYRPKLDEFVSKDHNRSYEIAREYAQQRGVMLIRGTEVTRRMAPGHFNAIFIEDANPFEKFVNKKDSRDGSNIAETLAEAKKQGAFVFWNHPWFQHKENISEWAAVHEDLYKKGLISGIEVINGDRYDPVVLDWCLSKNLTVLGTSDIHAPMYLGDDEHRSMTIVFAEAKTQPAIHKALAEGKTVAYFNNSVCGKEEMVKRLVEASLLFKVNDKNDKMVEVKLENLSSVPYKLKVVSCNYKQLYSGLELTAESLQHKTFRVPASLSELELKVEVKNAWVGGEKNLECTFTIPLK